MENEDDHDIVFAVKRSLDDCIQLLQQVSLLLLYEVLMRN